MATFVCLEGGDGCGKSTLQNLISEDFKKKGLPLLCTREPGGTPIGEKIRELILNTNMEPLTELYLYEAARAEHVAKVIRPALDSQKHVLCDRFTFSTLAYQGYGRGLGIELVEKINQTVTNSLKPDLVIWLKLPQNEALRRSQQRGPLNRFDQEKEDFKVRVFKAFETLSNQNPKLFIVLEALKEPQEIYKELQNHTRWKHYFN